VWRPNGTSGARRILARPYTDHVADKGESKRSQPPITPLDIAHDNWRFWALRR